MDGEGVETRGVDEVELGHVEMLRQRRDDDGNHQLPALHFEVRLVRHFQLPALDVNRRERESKRASA